MPFEPQAPDQNHTPSLSNDGIQNQPEVPSSASGVANASNDQLQLQFLHPASVLFEIASQVRRNLITAGFALFFAANSGGIWFGVAAFASVVALIFALIRYFTLRFRVYGEDLIVDEGLFFRRHRTVPVHRIQNIDMVQNPLHRMFGVAEVRVETASGAEPEATMRVLSLDQIDKLRNAVFHRRATPASSESSVEGTHSITNVTEVRPTDKNVIMEIPTKRLILAGVLSDRGLVVVSVIAGLASQTEFWERKQWIDFDALVAIIPKGFSWSAWVIVAIGAFLIFAVFLKIFSAVWYVVRFHGFRMERSGDDMRIRCGLFTKVSATIPRRRIQFISIHRSWLGRYFGLASIRIETAGGTGGDADDAAASVGRKWFLPTLPESDIPRMLGEIRPGLTWNESQLDWKPLSPKAGKRMLRLALIACLVLAAVGGFIWRPWGAVFGIAILPGAIWFANKKAKAHRYARTHDFVAYRSGLLTRKTSLTFFDKIQTVNLSQSPFDRRWNMATLAIDTAGAGPADHAIVVEMLDEHFAQSEHAAVIARSCQSV